MKLLPNLEEDDFQGFSDKDASNSDIDLVNG
jgi:hypothetical protein